MKNQLLLEVQPNSNPDQDSQTQNYFIDSAGRKAESTRNVHFILQGKGGIGKTFVSTIIAQFVKQQDPNVLCLDTDPINATFASFPSLGVRSIVLLEKNNMINERRFDDMMEQILEADSNVVVDNGAASYVPMSGGRPNNKYRSTPNWERPVMDFTNSLGVDHVVEVGGASTLEKSLEVITYGGTISIIGHVSGDTVALNLRNILRKGAILQGIYVGSRQMFEKMNSAIALHKLKPVIDKSFPFAEAREALQYLESGAHFGKVCIST